VGVVGFASPQAARRRTRVKAARRRGRRKGLLRTDLVIDVAGCRRLNYQFRGEGGWRV
jgi:hypothetical protein